jgi:uncharacterized protein YbjT (DUF2867 family)
MALVGAGSQAEDRWRVRRGGGPRPGVGSMELVVGATGQVGSEVVRQLSERGQHVRAFVRADSNTEPIERLPNVELVVGDLFDPASVERAVDGCEHVIATANGIAPRRRRDHSRLERLAYPPLFGAALGAGVARFVLLSSVVPGHDELPMQRDKRVAEAHLAASGLEYAIVRPGAFMDGWLALVGSSIPLRGEPSATLRRDFWFMKTYRRFAGRTIEDRGTMMVNGGPDLRTSFISVRDVASILIACTTHDRARNAIIEVGGPEALSWREVADIYGQILGREVRIQTSPAGLLRVVSKLLAPFSPAAASLLALNVALAEADMVLPSEPAEELGVGPLDRVEIFLKTKAALPDLR